MSIDSLQIFNQLTASWFLNSIGSPTAVQEEAWPVIAAGAHTLVCAPTGTGKTLSAFLVFIDRLKEQLREGSLKQELQLIYVSPLKSLAGDIRENLRRPLDGILKEEYSAGIYSENEPKELSIAIRTGDTPQIERRRMTKKPPHILITTPESLYLMLTSKSGQSILRTAKAVIIDELHAIIDSKRGAHLMLSIARLDSLCPNPLQRIGLSATIEPLSLAAEYLSPDPVKIIAPKMHKEVRLSVTSPFSDTHTFIKDSVWQELSKKVYEHCKKVRSVIAFVEGRAYAEKLAYYVNQLGGEDFARTHHGSLSKEQRFAVEHALRNGNLRLLCATSSMELGIDVGDIDQVLQIGCPHSISSTMQRLGRAGHNPERVSVMYLFPREASEGLYCGLTAEVARNGGVEHSRPPRLCLDVLAQHLVSMATEDGYHLDDVMVMLHRAYPFRDVTKDDVKEVLCMLAGDYEHERNIPVRPRVLYDRIHDYVEGDPYSRMLAVSTGGTIPDKGMFSARTENGAKIGELDEEFVFESRLGDRFLLGTFAWKIVNIQKDSVVVTQSNTGGARLPFWKGEMKGRGLKTGLAFGAILHRLGCADEEGLLFEELRKLGLDETASNSAGELIKRQLAATHVLPDDRTIIIEHFRDETGNHQMMVHSVFGRQVNTPLAILTMELAKRQLKTNISFSDDDDGFLIFPFDDAELPEGILRQIEPESARPILEALLPATPIFNINFRYNIARALMMGVRKSGRQPLWVQRMRSADMLDYLMKYENHPLIRETKRECLEDYWDLPAVEFVLNGIRSGSIEVHEIHLDTPSPMSLPLRRQAEAENMYDYTPTPASIHHSVLKALEKAQMITPSPEQLTRVSERKHIPEDEKQLHSLLMIEGDLIAGELNVPIEWLEKLAGQGRTKYIEPGLWIATEHTDLYNSALIDADKEAMQHIVLRSLRYRGAQSVELISERYLWTGPITQDILETLRQQGSVVESDGFFYHAELYDRARQETVKSRRMQIHTLPSERYAALLSSRTRITASPSEQLEKGLKKLCGLFYPPSLWESVLLPARVNGYRPDLLDTLLSQGNLFWYIKPDEGLSFRLYEDIDWEAELSVPCEVLDEKEKIIYEALLKRGASFMQRLSGLIEGDSPYDTIMKLVQKGLICADSFKPVRQLLNKEKLEKSTIRQRVSVRAKAQNTGRFELSRPIVEHSAEQILEQIFDRVIILSRETIQGLPWLKALETLRIWEYTGRVRRGYFIEGLSGIQFIREKDFAGIMQELEQPRDEIIWISAIDPMQPWGKSLPHLPDRAFLNLPGSTVAMKKGVPIAIFERQGKTLRIFDFSSLPEVLNVFVKDYSKRCIFANSNRLVIKEYPKEAAEALSGAGFIREMQDYVLYRGPM